jgi:hypothetical protein
LQITAEQILRESKALQEAEHKAPVIKITDPEELAEYRLQVRPSIATLDCSCCLFCLLRPLASQRCLDNIPHAFPES